MSNRLTLQTPNLAFRDSYIALVREFQERNEQLVPFPLEFPFEDFDEFLQTLERCSRGVGIPDDFVPHTTFWLVDQSSEVVGVSNMRHSLTDRLRSEGGHIGYGIRPSRRGNGYGNEILRLTLNKAGKMGLTKVLVTCGKKNLASATVITNNGGVLSDEEFVENFGDFVQRFWIAIKPHQTN